MEETREPLKNPVTAAVWRGLPDVAKEAIGMIVEAAGAGHLEMYNGIIAIAVRQCHAVTINPAAELRPGHEIMRGQGGRLHDALRDRAYADGAGPAQPDPAPVAGQRAKMFDSRHVLRRGDDQGR